MFSRRNHLVKCLLVLCFFFSACTPRQQINGLATETVPPRLTKTPQPTLAETSIQTSLSISENYKLPSWLADPNFEVFAMVNNVLENSNEITFVNANTHDKFVISVPNSNVSRYFWTPDGKSFGFIVSDFLDVFLIDLRTGKVVEHSIPENSSQCLFEYQKEKYLTIKYIEVYSSSPLDPSFFCPEPYFSLSQKEKNGERVTVFENLVTAQKIELAGSGENLLNVNYAISPTQTQLAVLQGSEIDPYGLNLMGSQIRIYNLTSGDFIASFEGKFCLLKWSPDGNKLLTTETESTECYSNASPTILYPAKNLSKPITAIENAQHSKVHISTYNWSQDSNFLYYVYLNPDRSDVCHYDLQNDQIFCPTSSFSELSGLNVEYYKLSPDEKFLAFSYGHSCHGCDYWGGPSSAVMRIDGSDLLSLGNEVFLEDVSSTYPYNTLMWRPVPNQ